MQSESFILKNYILDTKNYNVDRIHILLILKKKYDNKLTIQHSFTKNPKKITLPETHFTEIPESRI